MTPGARALLQRPAAHGRVLRPRGERGHEAGRLVRAPAPGHRPPRPGQVALPRLDPRRVQRGAHRPRARARARQVQDVIRTALGVALLLAAAGLIVRAYLRLVEHARRRDGRAAPLPQGRPTVDAARRCRRSSLGAARRHRRRPDLGGLGLAHHHRADGALPRRSRPASWSAPTWSRRCRWWPPRRSATSCSATSSWT